jgi:hypothetical protein
MAKLLVRDKKTKKASSCRLRLLCRARTHGDAFVRCELTRLWVISRVTFVGLVYVNASRVPGFSWVYLPEVFGFGAFYRTQMVPSTLLVLVGSICRHAPHA